MLIGQPLGQVLRQSNRLLLDYPAINTETSVDLKIRSRVPITAVNAELQQMEVSDLRNVESFALPEVNIETVLLEIDLKEILSYPSVNSETNIDIGLLNIFDLPEVNQEVQVTETGIRSLLPNPEINVVFEPIETNVKYILNYPEVNAETNVKVDLLNIIDFPETNFSYNVEVDLNNIIEVPALDVAVQPMFFDGFYSARFEAGMETGGPGFKENDLVIAVSKDKDQTGDEVLEYELVARVRAVFAEKFYGGDAYDLDFTGNDLTPKEITDILAEQGEGMNYVRFGNTEDVTRQDFVMIASDMDGTPFIDVVDGMGAISDWVDYTYINPDNIRTRVGKLDWLDGKVDSIFTIEGYGIWSDNAYFENIHASGQINIESGLTRYELDVIQADLIGKLEASDVGNMAFYDLVREAMEDETIIVGGYIDTSLINADWIFTQNANVTGVLTIGDSGEDSGVIKSYNYVPNASGFIIDYLGDAEFNSVTIRNGNVFDSIINQPAIGSERSILGWQTDIEFYVDSGNLIRWQNGDIEFANGDIVSTDNSSTSTTISSPTWFYFNTFDNKIHYTTNSSVAVGSGKIIMAFAKPNFESGKKAELQGFGGATFSKPFITTEYLAADSVTANEILVNNLSAISANMGTVTSGTFRTNSGTIQLNNDGSGQLADGNIFWDIDGNIGFQSAGENERIAISGGKGDIDFYADYDGDGTYNGLRFTPILYYGLRTLYLKGINNSGTLDGAHAGLMCDFVGVSDEIIVENKIRLGSGELTVDGSGNLLWNGVQLN